MLVICQSGVAVSHESRDLLLVAATRIRACFVDVGRERNAAVGGGYVGGVGGGGDTLQRFAILKWTRERYHLERTRT